MKRFLFAGILLAAALVFAVPSKADSVAFTLTGGAMPGGASFTLPQTFTPDVTQISIQYVFSVPGTLLGSNIVYGTIDLGNTGSGAWAFGSSGHTMNGIIFPGSELLVSVAGLFTMNPDGTITLNAGQWTLLNNVGSPLTLTTTIIPGPVGTPEPATLALLGVGGFALSALRRRKTA